MTAESVIIGLLSSLVIFWIAHLSVDKDIPSDKRIVAWTVIGVIVILFLVFGIILEGVF